eukprot:CCRYP_008184-RB/>CCRYP_008184-RB protein AED:0.09 eAED:0.29 QI:0/0/0/1/0/0/3/0/532
MSSSGIKSLAFGVLIRTAQIVNGHRDGGFHFIRRKEYQDETLVNQLAIKPWSSKHAAFDATNVVLTPLRENVVETDVRNGSSALSSAETDLVFASIYPHQTQSFITFDLSQSDVFNDYAVRNKEHLLDANLQLFSFHMLPSDTSFDIVVRDRDERSNNVDMMWHVDSSMVNLSSCARSKNCWIDLDVTDGLLWSIEEQRNMKDWNPSQALTLIVRVSIPRQQAKVSASFASSKYNGGSFAPRLSLEFPDQANNAVNYYSSSMESQKKPARKHIVKGVKGPRKKPKNQSSPKTNNNISAANAVGVRPNKGSSNTGIQYYTYIIIDTENLPELAKNEPGRKHLVKGVKGPKKKPKENNSLANTRRPSSSLSDGGNDSASFQPNKVTSNSFSGIKPNTSNVPGTMSNVEASGPNGPIVSYSGQLANGSESNGPNGPSVAYSQNSGPNGPSVAYSQNSGPNGPNVSYSGQEADGTSSRSETKKWYMNYQIGNCVQDCSEGRACGGIANFWDMLFDSQAKCCQQMNFWNPSCMDGRL